jgi:hypothetical protein
VSPVRKALLAIGLGALLLASAELAIRVVKRDVSFQPDPDVIRSRLPHKGSQISGFETDDNLNGRSSQIPDRPVPSGVRPTNNLGLRMAEPVGPKRPGERRVLLLGDAFAEAVDVSYEQRFDGVALRMLKERAAEWNDWRIINAAITNACPSQYLLMLRRLLPLVEPEWW